MTNKGQGQDRENKPTLWDKLEKGLSRETGKRVFYQLTDAEGGTTQHRKCFAIIDFEYKDGRRVDGSLAVSLSIFRPVHLGGFFQKEMVAFASTREPGTCSTIQNEDLGE